MRRPRFRFSIRGMMIVVGVVALLVWAAMMGWRSYQYSRLARAYGETERGWRSIAERKRPLSKDASKFADYYGPLARKYEKAAWSPWKPVAPDPEPDFPYMRAK